MTDQNTAVALRQLERNTQDLHRALTDTAGVLKSHKSVLDALQNETAGLAAQLRRAPDDSLVRELRQSLTNTDRTLAELRARFDDDKNQPQRIKNIDDVPGYKTPKWYCCDIPLTSGTTTLTSGTVEIDPDGPFVITQIAPYFQVQDTTAENINGRILPCTAAPLFFNQGGGVVVAALNTNIAYIPELQFQVQISGSGRFWTNELLPAAAFYGWPQPLFTGIMGWVDPTDRIVVQVSPLIALPRTGTVRFVMHGFQILNPDVRLTRMMGFGS